MGTLTVTMYVTLDGIVQSPGAPDEDEEDGFPHGGWQVPFFDDEAFRKDVMEDIEAIDALLLGRKTYDIFAAYWPDRPAEDPIARKLNAIPKYVASRTREELGWDRASVIDGDTDDAVRRIKQAHERLHVFGSSELLASLLDHDLVDRLKVYVYPVILGTGKRGFRDGVDPRRFDLVESCAYPSGAVLLSYEAAGEPSYGTVEDDAEP